MLTKKDFIRSKKGRKKKQKTVSYPGIPTIRQVNVNGKRLKMIKHICVIPNKNKQAEGEDVLNKTLSEGYSVIRDIDTPPSIVYVLGLYDQGSDSDD